MSAILWSVLGLILRELVMPILKQIVMDVVFPKVEERAYKIDSDINPSVFASPN